MKPLLLSKLLASSILLIAVFSCSDRNSFEKKYGKEISQINHDRVETTKERKEILHSSPPSTAEIEKLYSSQENENKYSYVDVEQFAEKKYLPDKNYYEQMQIYNPSHLVPHDLFSTKYNLTLASKFHSKGSEFDKIKMLPYDAYGIKATLSQKNYLMIGNGVLQNNIDTILENRSRRDILASKILIKEQMEIKQKQRMAKYIGDYVIDEETNKEIAQKDTKKLNNITSDTNKTKKSSTNKAFFEKTIKN